jgi:uncharacterized RDD family membrane protein YckC
MSDEPPLEAPAGPSARRKGSPYPKAELVPRLLARLLDFVIAGVLTLVLRDPGALIALMYLLLGDGFLQGQSPGKKVFGLKVVHVPDRRPANYRDSAFRNAPIAVVWIFFLIPLLGWFLFFTLGLAIIAFEAYMVRSDALGIRIGDVFADTQVVDTKVFTAEMPRPVLIKSVVERAPTSARDAESPGLMARAG